MRYRLLNCTAYSYKKHHSHKKRKDSTETSAELVVLRAYVENRAILEPILPYPASKCKQTQKQSIRVVCGLTFLPFCETIISFCSFLGQDVFKPGSNCAIIVCDLSQKHKITPFHRSGGSKTNKL